MILEETKQKNLSNGRQAASLPEGKELKKQLKKLLDKHQKRGLYARLVAAGLLLTEGKFIEAKRGRTGYETNLKIYGVLKKIKKC